MRHTRRQQSEAASDVTTAQDFAGTDRCHDCGAFQTDTRGHCDNCESWL